MLRFANCVVLLHNVQLSTQRICIFLSKLNHADKRYAVQECDATKDEQRRAAGFIKNL